VPDALFELLADELVVTDPEKDKDVETEVENVALFEYELLAVTVTKVEFDGLPVFDEVPLSLEEIESEKLLVKLIERDTVTETL
jgi:hypothetical protein